jgi:hypothetical protein
MAKALLGNDSVNTSNNRSMSVYCSLLECNNEFAAVSTVTVAMQ